MPPPETPRKAVKTDMLSTPGKRRFDDTDDVFKTPSTGPRGRNLFSTAGLLSPVETPTPFRFKDIPSEETELNTEILDGLRSLHIQLPEEAVEVIKRTCNKQSLKMQGIAKGRDISRAAIKTKDGKIAELQNKIAALEAEREMNKAVIRHLRRDIEMTERKPP
ncbi:hypothetical protein MMC06_000398 [Schaereria dolodes]|nr:hypothetical protein [Schaereria dolodes]